MFYPAGSKVKTPAFEKKEGQIGFYKDGIENLTDLTPGLEILLFEPNHVFNNASGNSVSKETITQEDVEQYLRIYGQLKMLPGNSNRYKEILKLQSP